MKKIIIVCMIGAIFLLCSSCSSKKAKVREETYETLSFMAEDLSELSKAAYEAYDYDDFDYMKEILYSIHEKCKELSDKAESLADKYADKVYDYE